jgi:hypothetical protein
MPTKSRKPTVLVIAIISALVLAALGAADASAWTAAKNLTAFTCVKGAGALDFSDSHCDHAVSAGKGEWGHVAIPVGKTTEAETVNTTPGLLKTIVLGAAVEIQCTEAHGTGTFKNEEPSAKVHTGSAEGTSHLSGCTFLKPAGCKVEGGKITLNPLIGVPVEDGVKMGGEIKPVSGTTFTTIKVVGCALQGVYVIRGSLVAVGGAGATAKGTGSTAVYLPENESIFFGPEPASFTITTQVQTPAGIAISGTTAT